MGWVILGGFVIANPAWRRRSSASSCSPYRSCTASPPSPYTASPSSRTMLRLLTYYNQCCGSRSCRIRMFFLWPPASGSGSISQRYGFGSLILLQWSKNSKKNPWFLLFLWLLFLTFIFEKWCKCIFKK